MQTFLPVPDFKESARTLDMRRLGKQRVEAKQLLTIVRHKEKSPDQKIAWGNHPAALRWQGSPDALASYMNVMIEEWVARGYKNTMLLEPIPDKLTLPPWWGGQSLHASHRSNLLRKDPVHYGKFNWTEGPDLPYIWPVAGDPRPKE